MRAFEFLIEYRVKGARDLVPRDHKYRDGNKPDWYEKAVQLKTDNPRMTAIEIGKLVGASYQTVLNWLTGAPDSRGYIYNDNPPFTSNNFPKDPNRKYYDGEKPWWYEEAVAMRKQGMTWHAIANKLSTPEKKVTGQIIHVWLVKGRKYVSGNLINKDAPFEPRPYNTKKIDTALIKELILDPKLSDADIVELVADEKGDKMAGQVRAMLPQLKAKLNKDPEVIDKKTGVRQDGFVQ